ncbi:hypothetical protein OG394_00840 [Kribbella sp. NBC_01245]|uniref:hypothetical protein n=1 Tax=Kribbella sp. NBC_01245 TaxID=2903578 RepID=UPI002E2A59E9|nr:hypothetical protein [Kribbella sp. NBC_01245]
MAQLQEMTVRELLVELARVEDEVRHLRTQTTAHSAAKDDEAIVTAAQQMAELVTREQQLIAELHRRTPEAPPT